MKHISEFLWMCAGANRELLRKSPNDHAKYAGVGGTILFTALMAAFSGGYAMYFVFGGWILAVLFGVFWGLLIFNLDRFIVNSMKIEDQSNKLTWAKVRLQMPRLIMAIFLGLVISTPLEMKIFSDRIESQLLKENAERITDAKNASGDFGQMSKMQGELDTLLNGRKRLNDELLAAQKSLKDEAEGNALSGKAGHGTIYEDKQKYAEECQKALDNWDASNKSRQTFLEGRIQALQSSVSRFEQTAGSLQEDGFVARYEAFSSLKSETPSLEIMSWMITLLFIIIEIIPSFFKLVMPSCTYTTMCEREDELTLMAYQAEADKREAEMKNAGIPKDVFERLTQCENSIALLSGKINDEMVYGADIPDTEAICSEKLEGASASMSEKIEAVREEQDAKLSQVQKNLVSKQLDTDGKIQRIERRIAEIVEVLQMINRR